MKKFFLSMFASVICASASFAQNTVIKSPKYFTSPIRDGYEMFPDSLVFPQNAEEIRIPDIGMIGELGNYYFPKLRRVIFGNIDYVPGGLLLNMPNVEELVFEGYVGHFDCSLAINCPKLRKIVFKGPVSSTGGPGFVFNNPQLESVVFESVVADFGISSISSDQKCPKLNGYTVNGALLHVSDTTLNTGIPIERLISNPRLVDDMNRMAQWQSEVLRARDSKWVRSVAYSSAKVLLPVLEKMKSPEAATLKSAMAYAWGLGDDVKTELEVLQESPAYASGQHPDITFRYAPPSDSLLAMARERFNLDSIAGNGSDISRIKNLLYWVHDNIRHNGNNGLAPGRRNLINTYESARRDSCGYNCRALAISLAEALLAEGIPARYVTCIPKAWKTDNDCHVICVAWSESLGKWVWVDPTFAAYVTDENGLMLHPGEVRERLQKGLPLVLNKDANWNNKYIEDKKHYLDYYMAKNLYIMDICSFNQAEPEGESSHPQGSFMSLVPQGVEYPHTHYTTSDEKWFWQAPRK